MKVYYFGVFLLAMVVWSGCALPYFGPASEIDFRGHLPKSVVIDRNAAMLFDNEFASETGMGITSISSDIGPDADRFIDVAFENSARITGIILIDTSKNQFDIVVYGDPNSPATKEIANKGTAFFLKKYPEGNIAPYKRRLLLPP